MICFFPQLFSSRKEHSFLRINNALIFSGLGYVLREGCCYMTQMIGMITLALRFFSLTHFIVLL